MTEPQDAAPESLSITTQPHVLQHPQQYQQQQQQQQHGQFLPNVAPNIAQKQPLSPTYQYPSNPVFNSPMSAQFAPSAPSPNTYSPFLPSPSPGYLMLPIPFPVKPLFNNVLNAPENIAEMRQQFFLLESPIIQSHYEHEIYWPFMDNFWVRNKVKDSGDCRTEYYWCRLFRKQDPKSSIPPELRKRKCSIRSAVGCEMKLRKRFWKDGNVEISNHGTCAEHCHSMSEMDEIKRNSGIRSAISNEIGKGYKPTEVKRVMLKNREILDAAGGRGVSIKDCHNAALIHNRENKGNKFAEKEDDQVAPRGSLQDEDEPILGAILQDHNRREEEVSRECNDDIAIEVLAQAQPLEEESEPQPPSLPIDPKCR